MSGPRRLTSIDDELARSTPGDRGALWRLAEADRDLDANLVALPPGGSIEEHVGGDLDVLVHVVSGSGEAAGAGDSIPLTPGVLVWLARGSRRGFRAGEDGLRYLTVHRRREGGGVIHPGALREAPGLD